MKAYKLKEQYYSLDKSRLFYQLGTEVLVIATPTKPQSFYSSSTFDKLKLARLVEEVDLLNEKWVHPHLYKPVKKELENLKINLVV